MKPFHATSEEYSSPRQPHHFIEVYDMPNAKYKGYDLSGNIGNVSMEEIIDQESEYYQERNENWDKYCTLSQYTNDLFPGKLNIYRVPFEYRTHTAYIKAIAWAYRQAPYEHDINFCITEKKMIDYLLQSDIMKLDAINKSIADDRRWIYNDYCAQTDIRWLQLLRENREKKVRKYWC